MQDQVRHNKHAHIPGISNSVCCSYGLPATRLVQGGQHLSHIKQAQFRMRQWVELNKDELDCGHAGSLKLQGRCMCMDWVAGSQQE